MEQGMFDRSGGGRFREMPRRLFLERLGWLTGGVAAASALTPELGAKAPAAQASPIVPEDDPALVTGKAEYDAGDTKVAAYLARRKGGGRHPGVVVIHENRGLTPHIQDVARRLGKEGFLALAPDMLSPLGGTPPDQQAAVKLIGTLDQDKTVARLAAAVRFLAAHPESTGKVGVVGFCWGGAMVNRVMASGAGARAGVSYYGRVLPAEEVPKISGPLLLHYAGNDPGVNSGIEGYEAALKANNKPYEKYVYEGAQHAFNNDTNPERYNKEAATLAWGRTIAFFQKHLK